ncbi:MAG: 16S rRNA (cytosine(967)-C(5))-methyltransferase RsmB [Methylophaga sp.]|nr:16S rRNA (cytosine(967)-C(5))-methyltransferase RsmB [Methylophaga sp.]
MAKSSTLCSRSAAAKVIMTVAQQKQSLNPVLTATLTTLPAAQRSLCQQLSYGVLRLYPTLQALADPLLQKKLKNKDQDIYALLLIGIYQLRALRIPPHAAISETVDGASLLGKNWAKGLLNACLRQYQRRQTELENQANISAVGQFAHPQWLIDAIRHDWPDHWQQVLTANNQQAPMILRVNQQKITADDYQSVLAEKRIASQLLDQCPQGLLLDKACDISELPHFADGWLSVQDGAAQQVAVLLDLQPGMQVLDACAAPGGKTAHMLELVPDLSMLALDIDAQRLQRVAETLQRLDLNAKTLAADAANIESWWQGQHFDRILIDAPCSGSGVIRRHPDIKLLRRPEDIDQLATRQQQLLDNLWPLLKPDGILVYTTCSVFARENTGQIHAFLQRHADARLIEAVQAPARKAQCGYQRLPGDDAFDGFFYACLQHN